MELINKGGEKMLRKKALTLSIVLLAVLLLTSIISFPASAAEETNNRLRPADAPFDISKVVDVSKTEAFVAEHKQGRLRQLNPPRDDTPFKQTKEQEQRQQDTILQTEHHWWGADIPQIYDPYPPPMVWGAFARHYIDPSLTLGTGEVRTLYAPTMKPPAPCPLEAVTIYYAYDTQGHMNRYFGIWNHNEENPTGWTDVDFTFAELENEGYLSDAGYYEVSVIWYDSMWEVYLRNFDTTYMELIYDYANSNYDHSGWDIYEAYYDTNWPDTPYLKASEIMIYCPFDGGWFYNSGGVLDGWSGFSLYHGWNNLYYEWYAGTPFYASDSTKYEDGGVVDNHEYLRGSSNDGNYAHIHCSDYPDRADIIGTLNAEVTYGGHIEIYGCSGQGGYLSDLRVYVSEDNWNYYQVGSVMRITATSPYWINVGDYGDSFRYIRVVGYDSGYSVCLYLDSVRITR